MSEASKAVFLSYASQDAEAAKHIAAALRGAGVEVWFDAEGGLEHGDEWDAKIRRQIKECVLFIPLISANTEAREEGYFRIEWDLAAERARGFASGVAFILPVVIDQTREQEALVPDRFRAVQWTRLPGGTVPPEVLQRFLKLWSHRTGFLKQQSAPGGGSAAPVAPVPGPIPTARKKPAMWIGVISALVAAAVAFWYLRSPRNPAPSPRDAAPTAASAGTESEARQLLAKAWALMNNAALARAELELADGFCKRATELEPNNADAWAAWSQVDSWFIYHNFDQTATRREGARTKATRALQLAPASFEARLAEACYLVRGASGSGVRNAATSMDASEADRILVGTLRERPAEPRALLARGILQRNLGKKTEARASFEELARNPAYAALAWNEIGWGELFGTGDDNYQMALRAADRSIALQPYWGNLGLRMLVAESWLGDLDLAKSALEQIPAAARQEDFGVAEACGLYYLRREPADMLRVLENVPRDWLHGNNFDGPTAWWVALAHEIAGHRESARLQWQIALKLVDQRLAEDPAAEPLLETKATMLAKLGRNAEAESVWRLVRENSGEADVFNLPRDAAFEVALGHADAAIALLERAMQEGGPRIISAANVRLDPGLDPLRENPQFRALQARLEADPRFNPAAKAPAATAAPSLSLSPSPPSAPDGKSVAVLAFANLSDDKANEYFSDGISEELLNVLAKIPELKVAARTSAFSFKGKDVPVPEIARQLGVAYVVEGSVRKSGDRVRITAQLIKASDGFHVWSDSFTRDLKDVFGVQDEIAGLIAQNLRAKMALGHERAAPAPEAYALILQARHAAALQTTDGGHDAVKFYRLALAQSPGTADAWAEMAHVYQYLARFGGIDTTEGMQEARQAAQKALELDPEQPLALDSLGWVQRTADHAWRDAIKSFRHALAVSPDDVTIMSDAAICFLNVGLVDDAIASAGRAAERDPLNPAAHWTRGIILAFSGHLADAEASYRRAIELAPKADEYQSHLARVLALLGRVDEARAAALAEPSERYRLIALATVDYTSGNQALAERELAEVLAKYGDDMAGYAAATYAHMGKVDEAFRLLDRAYERRDAAMAWIKVSYYNASLHDDPRWPVLLHKMGLADDQLK
ncbi:MAG TPA: TIR domain-containing protein [Candidatus Didemnitutus sp.]|nr:TIR domain-containing protein [Candidatus Didemnitutus sp.]